jgi:hypothetical protein
VLHRHRQSVRARDRRRGRRTFTDAVNVKYESDYGTDFFADNALWRARPQSALALDEADFPGSPTRWRFS